MADASGLNLKEPEPMDWEHYQDGGSKYQAPPPALGPDGKPITYYVQVPGKIENGADDEGNRTYLLDPLKVVKSGPEADGYEIRFTRVSTKKFTNKKTGSTVEASSVGNFLRAAGVLAKPQKNSEYDAAVNLTKGKIVPITLDWTAKNKETGEAVFGYDNFPEDPLHPGRKKAILKQGDVYLDKDGVKQVVKSEVLFANARQRYFVTKK
jgi:hypothetical protein